MVFLEEPCFSRLFTVEIPVITWQKNLKGAILVVEVFKKWLKISVLFCCLLCMRSTLHKYNYPRFGGTARQGWFPPHHLNPAPQPAGVGVAAGMSKHQYMWVECLGNTGSVRSHLNHPIIQTPWLFTGMTGHYCLNNSLPWSWQIPSPVPHSDAIGREKDLEGEHGRVGSGRGITSGVLQAFWRLCFWSVAS